jgi:phosphatidylglycerophosphate synthase
MQSYINRVTEIFAAQEFKEFYSRIFSGKLSPFIAAACVGTGITPNHITALMIPTGITGGIVLSLGTPWGFLAGGVLFVLVNILDAADGELARYTKQTSDFGDYLDRVAHYMTNTSIVMGLGIGLYVETGHGFLLPLMFLTNSAIIGDDAIRDLLVTCGLQKSEGDTSDRKLLKLRTKISMGTLGAVIHALTSNVAMFHITTLLGLLQLVWPGIHLLEAYFVFVGLVIIARFTIRSRKIRTSYA